MFVVLFGEPDENRSCFVSEDIGMIQILVRQHFAKKPPKSCSDGDFWEYMSVKAEQDLEKFARGNGRSSMILANDVEVYLGAVLV